jgi:hypothetical protein
MLRIVAAFAFLVFIVSMGCSKYEAPSVVIHFVEWDILTRVSLSCEDIAEMGDSVVVSDQSEVAGFVSIVDKMQLRPLPDYSSIDARICVQLLDRRHNVTRTIGISYQRLMAIEGRVYELDEQLFDLIVSYLPAGYLH